jgi:hypothetical protein
MHVSGPGEVQQAPADRLGHEPPDDRFIAEAHLSLLGMNVHIDACGIEFEEQAADRVAPLHQGVVIPLEQREVEPPALDGALIDEEVLVGPGRPRDAWRADESPDASREDRGGWMRWGIRRRQRGFQIWILAAGLVLHLIREIDPQQGDLAAKDLSQPFLEGVEPFSGGGPLDRCPLEDGPGIADEPESYLGVG